MRQLPFVIAPALSQMTLTYWSGAQRLRRCHPRAQRGDAWAGEIVTVDTAPRHRHRQRQGRAANERAGPGREGTVGRLQPQTFDGASAAHRKVPPGKKVRYRSDDVDGGYAEESEGPADVLSVHNDLTQPCGGRSQWRCGAGDDTPEPLKRLGG